MIVLTEKHLKIPYAIAARHAHPDTNEFDELVAAGNYGLAKAAASYTPDREAKPETHLFNWVVQCIKRQRGRGGKYTNEARWRRLTSLDDTLSAGGETTHAETVAAKQEPDRLEINDLAAKVLSKLKPVDREIYVLRHAAGLTLKEVGERFGVDQKTVRARLDRIQKTLDRVAKRVGDGKVLREAENQWRHSS